MTIHQLQATLVMEQDRILVRLNTHAGEELRLWLTRRMVKYLFPQLLKASTEAATAQTRFASYDGADRSALTQFKKQESLLQADFSTPFINQATALPIGAVPLLATTVHITACEGGALRLGFEENLADSTGPRSFEVTLGPDLIHGFLHLLESALQHADWGLGLKLDSGAKEPEAAISATGERPQYLN